MLETVVHHDQTDLGMLCHNTTDTLSTIFTNHHHRRRELELDLQGLIADITIRVLECHLAITLRLATITARQQCHIVRTLHIVNNHLGRRSLTRTSNSDISDTHNRDVELFALEDTEVEEKVPKPHPRFVQTSRYFFQQIHSIRKLFFKDKQNRRIFQTIIAKQLPLSINS